MMKIDERIVGIDSIRAFAALSVMLAHTLGPILPDLVRILPFNLGSLTELSKYIFTGHPAVIVFFVVSGFCIHYPYVNGTLPILPFWAARWTRIMIPAVIAIICAKLVHLTGFNFWDGYILWSVVCELIYYSLYPVFVMISKFVSWRCQFYVAFFISCILVVVLGSDQYGTAHRYGPYLNWIIALPSWLAGCVLAERFSASRSAVFENHVGFWRFLIALTASILYWATMNTCVGYYLTMNAFSLIVFLWIGVEISAARGKRVFFFEWMGKWSYSIYLFHMIIFTRVTRILHFEWLSGETLVAIPVTLFLSYLVYLLIEKPSHKLARHIYNKLYELKSNRLLIQASLKHA